MKKTYFFVRHGETEFNRLRIVQGSGIDAELNDLGRSQAQSFFEFYRKEDFDYVICSSLKRTYQTVEPFLENYHIPHERTSLINEISWGSHEGRKGNAEMKRRYDEMVHQWRNGNFHASLEGAESAHQLASRLQRFLDYLNSLPYEKILVCTHGRSLRCLLCLMKNQHLRKMEEYDHFNTGLFAVEYENGQFSVYKENDIVHLEDCNVNANW